MAASAPTTEVVTSVSAADLLSWTSTSPARVVVSSSGTSP